MAQAFDERNGHKKLRDRRGCARCGGFLVGDGSLDAGGALESGTQRCVQCGEVVDPVIERNRQLRQDAMTVRCAARPVASFLEAKGPYS
jgi:ribosomal protein S27AE